jgi:TetR/AcrR family transcriptional repressor of nem operon
MPWDKQFDRDAVLDPAMETFWQQGYAATSMQDRVDAMDINCGSMYATFGDKRSLFLA